MARRKYRFRPDPSDSGIWNKLYITKKQRLAALKWSLYGLACILMLIIQEAFVGQLRIFGGFLDLTPCAIILVCLLEGSEQGSVFAFVMSMIYVFSGSAPDTLCIALITVPAVAVTLVRENYLRRSFGSALLCAAAAVRFYEVTVFLVGLFFGLTYPGRVGVFLTSGMLTVLTVPAMYPLLGWIGKIGGETWKE